MQSISFYLALVHHPVLNRKGETIASAVTNLDLHDLARLSCTYGISACYIVTPLQDQQLLVGRLLHHWCEGIGKELHPNRDQALRSLRVVDDIRTAGEDIERQCGRKPLVWATSARRHPGELSLSHARRSIADEPQAPRLLLLGTGWGLLPEVLEDADAVLEPVRGANGYNHLSVRCAAAILIDRLLSFEQEL